MPAAALALFAAGAVGCGATGADSAGDDDGFAFPDGGAGTPECFSSNECPTGFECSEFGTCVPPVGGQDAGASPPIPPEIEYELSRPASALRYVYVAMTELDSLAKIDGATLSVASVSVGDQPEVVVAIPGSNSAVVLDEANGTATVVRPTVDRDETSVVRTLPRLNEIRVDPNGRYAVAWFDLNKAALDAGGLEGIEDIGSFQDVTVIDLAPGDVRAVDLTVGFRPREVEFDISGQRAYIVTDDGISVVDLADATSAGPSIVPPIPVTDDPLSDPLGIDVDVVADGAFAVVREVGRAELRIVRVAGEPLGEMFTIPLAVEPSDVDISPDGLTAYAVLRDANALAVIDVPGDGFEPAGVTLVPLNDSLLIGSLVLSDAGDRGLLFTNAFATEVMTVIDLQAPGFPTVSYPLQKSVRLAGFDPSGDKAIIVHAKAFGDPDEATTFEEFIDRSFGYSVFDVATGFAKLEVTPVDPGAFAFAADAPRAYLILDGGDAEGAFAAVHTIELDTGVVREQPLSSPPDAVGVLPQAGVAFVSQRHGLGRMSFIDIETDAMRTVTGFDLNGRIID